MKKQPVTLLLILMVSLTQCNKIDVSTGNQLKNANTSGQYLGSDKGNILLNTFPVMQQKYSYDCAVAALYTTLHYFGSTLSYDQIGVLAQTDPINGTFNVNIVAMLKNLNVNFTAEQNTTIAELKSYTDQGWPSIIDIEYAKDRNTSWNNTWVNGHYVVVLDVDMVNNKVTFMDPDWGFIRHLTIDQVIERWHDQDAGTVYNNYAITIKSKGNS